MPQKIENVLLPDPCLKMRFAKIFLDRRNRLSIFIDEKHRRGAPAKRFNSKRAAARKKIENASADYRVAQAGKDGALNAVHRRPHSALRYRKPNAAGTPGDYSHGDAAGVAVAAG